MIGNRITRQLLGAATALVVALIPAVVFAQGPPVDVKEGKLATAMEKKAMKAFRMKEGYKGDAEAKKLGEKLFQHAKFSDQVELKADQANHMIHVGKNDPSSHFRIAKSTGDFSFNKGMKGYYNDQATPNLPGKEKAIELAKKHLTELGLMPANQEEVVLRHVGGLRQVDISEDGKVAERDKLVTVHFGRQIDGIDVGGPGSKIVVELGADGELVSLTKRWIEVAEEQKNERDFGPPADITQKLKDKLRNEGAKAKKIDVDVPDFGYFDDGEGNIEPAYFFNAELTYDLEDEGGQKRQHKEKYHGVVPALKSSKAKFDQLEKAKGPPGRSQPVDKDKPSVKD